MKITTKIIREYNPCRDGIDDFEAKYPSYSGTLVGVLSMENISYNDKIWLATKVLDKMTLVQWSLDCATMVVDNFNNEFPNDSRVNDCLDTIRMYINGEVDDSAARSAGSAAWSAAGSAARSARSAAESAAGSAAWSAGGSAARSARLAAESARSAAGSAWSAAGSAAESAAGSAAGSAAWSAAGSAAWSAAGSSWSAAGSAEKEQEDLNLSLLIALVDNMEEK